MNIQLTGGMIADLELLLAVGIILCLFFCLVVRRPVVGLACYIFLFITRAHEFMPHAMAFRPSVVVGMIMVAGLFLHLWINRQPFYFSEPQFLILMVFIAVCWISLFTKGQTFYDLFGHHLIYSLLLVFIPFFVTLNAVRSSRDLRIVLATLAFIGLTISLLTLVQSFVTGDLYGRSWAYKSEIGAVTRAGYFGNDPNFVAAMLAALLPIFYHLLNNEKQSIFIKGLCHFSIGLVVLTVFLTYSRTGFICMIAAFFLSFRKTIRVKHIISFAVLLIMIAFFVPGAFWERMAGTGTADATGNGRLFIYQASLNMIWAHPLTGVGYGQFYYLYSHFGGQMWNFIANQNTYLSIAAETGLVNLSIFLSLVWATFLDLRQIKRHALHFSDSWTAQASEALGASLIIILISGLTLDQSSSALFYIFIALVVVLRRICLQDRASHVEFAAKQHQIIAPQAARCTSTTI
jgi:O-antigen ligase